uniref:Variant surface glycoprotein 1125.5650 n=1 Tax=Trypanosoma brucei TaxID=5691 RepID=A0A1J0RD97_9TRYP|nr:variant surface glycoprotein 1125.5650 [Trypanosoma brucei]
MATKISKKTKNYQTVDVNLFTDATKTTCTQIDPKAAYTEYHKDTLGHALCTLRQLNKPTYTPIHRRPWTEVTADEKLLQALTDMINPGGKAPTDPQAKKALTDTYLGSDQNALTAQITDSIDKAPLNLKVRETTFDKTIFETAGSDGAATVLTYFQGKQLIESRAAATASSSPEVGKEISDKCKAITDKEKCKTEDECELKNDKCIAQVESSGKNGKATNTTGSNSFVIKASPFLLAFLLLHLNVKNTLHNCVILCNFIFAILRKFKIL